MTVVGGLTPPSASPADLPGAVAVRARVQRGSRERRWTRRRGYGFPAPRARPPAALATSRTVAGTIGSNSDLANVATELLRGLLSMKKAVRLLGVSISGFEFDEIRGNEQIALAL